MKAKKPRRLRIRPNGFVDCPFCGYLVHTGNPCAWCASCYCRFRLTESRRGESFVVFDPGMGPRSEGEAWAMAIAKSGGARIG